jgi:hypothetical protein
MQLPKTRMAKRGMLPKFRPAALGADAQARPSIRPVKPGPPPAPPSPARRLALANANANANQDDDGSYDLDDQLEASTLAGAPRDVSFDDETQARPVDDHLLNRLRTRTSGRDEGVIAIAPNAPADLGVDYESLPSLQVRPPFDTYERAFSERDPVTQLHASSHHVEEHDVWDRREGSGARERPSPPPPARSYAAPVPSYDDASDSAQWGRDHAHADDSQLDAPMIPPAPRVPDEMHPAFVVGVQRIRTATPDAWGTPVPPQAGQYLPSPMQAIQSSMTPQYAQNPAYAYQLQLQQQQQQQQQAYAQQAYAQQQLMQYPPQPTAYAHSPQQYLQAGQRQPTPMPMHLSSMPPMSASVADRMQRAQPVGGQLTQPPPAGAGLDANGKIARFAWFVAGAAFGITFAFFATGFFNGGKVTKDDAPVAPVATVAAAPLAPASPAAAPLAPAAALPPAAPAFAAAAPTAPAAAVGLAPAPAGFAPPPAGFAPGFAPVAPQLQVPAQAPVARFAPPVPPPRAPRFQAPPAPRRPSAPASQAPRNLGGGGPGADDDARPAAPPAAPAGSDLGDLLGAGLKP